MNENLIQQVSIQWDKIDKESYLHNIPALKGLDTLEFTNPVTFFCGENGTGKSTLLEAIAVDLGFNPEGGTKNYSFSTRDTHSRLWEAIRVGKGWKRPKMAYFLRAESFYNVATQEEEYGNFMELHDQSHGESFLSVIQSYFVPGGLYLLDEPESALSPQRQLTLLTEIYSCAQQGAQFIIATHSPILLGLPGAQILNFDDGTVCPCEYEDTDSYQITELFINNRERLLAELLTPARPTP